MTLPPLSIQLLPDAYAVCRLDAETPTPSWARGAFVSITRTSQELSIVCPDVRVPDDVNAQRDLRCLRVAGQLDFSMVGVLARLSETLAAANVSVFVVSTFDTDYLLVRMEALDPALQALVNNGYVIEPV